MAIFAVTFFVLWTLNRTRIETLALSGGWALLSVGFTFSLLSPDHWGRAIIAITHVPYTLAAICISYGILSRVKVSTPVPAMLSIALLGICTMAFTQRFHGPVLTDLYITNLTCGVIMVQTAQLFAQKRGRDGVETFLFIMLTITAAQFFIRPLLTFAVDGAIAAETYRDSVYYAAMVWMFAFGSVLFGLSQIAGAVKDQLIEVTRKNSVDELSGLLLRSEFETQVKAAFARAGKKRTPVSLIICDLDHFKQINDIWGHQIGDEAIARFGPMIRTMVRDSDIAGRVGGEEFCILVWDAREVIAAKLSERLRGATAKLQVSQDALDVRLSASFGVAEREHGETYRSLFARADQALYAAKKNGRDRVRTAGEPKSPDRAEDARKPATTDRLAG
ncbi:GGDEF domain-containing protein [Erythrobacter crassostreae]|uniref:diguanylate cyclase n=1 Tax=Erythrobacter crassostreae TaxID=2828328 RepID=A0A9X1JMN4_9SPHN|nr:GGDEF domain-containing protein [Erythrobacter crassostrea]MBV7259599.1 GGDEF domain-containing protein [Erythrobacter crassostrea]